MTKALGRWWYPAIILVPAFVSVVYFSAAGGVVGWLRLVIIVLWLMLAGLAISWYARRSTPR